MQVRVIGAGVAGLAAALELAERGASVEVVDRGAAIGEGACSWHAGGMLAPWCELASTEPMVGRLGALAIDWWAQRFPETVRKGSLVVAQPREAGELARFAKRTERYEWIGSNRIAELEPDLAGRFHQALYFPDEAHLDPRRALVALAARLGELGVSIQYGVDQVAPSPDTDITLDCRGFAARDVLPELRGVRGEMVVVRAPGITLGRPVRMLHPRMPLYIVPRGEGVFMLGATMIESEERTGISVRSMLELLGAAYALDPAFGEAEVLETGADLRPAFPDNLPRVIRRGGVVYLNGLYRHGFLLAPALADAAAQAVLDPTFQTDNDDADILERHYA